ncbi:DUF3298 domain-containing protein [Acidaminococcus timonensis]|uniref:DUF3298 and DUF4163 domain-containing protein n=1 Tax=Acidaminococcus timonensis TaxID=1871002 RepID=UPI002943A175|nr:DUF3298 domain-containing protein [Acidaminococcus timonensis]
MQHIVQKALAGLCLMGLCSLPALAGAQEAKPTATHAAHYALEQELQGYVPGQVIYAQKGIVIRSGLIKERDLIIHYPQVRVVGNPEVSRKISRYFEKAARISQKAYEKADTMDERLTSRVDYQVSHHGNRYLSFQRYGYDFIERAAHPTSWELGVTFDLTTGEPVEWQKLVAPRHKGAFTLDKINEALWSTDYGKGHYFYSDFRGLKKLPQNYYLDGSGNIHFVFGQYEIAPYAVGIIDLNMGLGL